MSSKMKKLIKTLVFSSSLILFFVNESSAQNRFSLNVGTGVYVSGTVDDNGHDVVGPMIGAEFVWQLNNWFSVGTNLNLGICQEGVESRKSDLGLSARAYFRPFAERFRFLELGVGPSVSYSNHIGNLLTDMADQGYEDWTHREFRDVSYTVLGVDFPVRLYVIDNLKYRLSINYDIKPVVFLKHGFLWTHSTASVLFGVKF